MKIGYYPGCKTNGSGVEYGLSIDAVSEYIGLELVEIPDWNCCGAFAASQKSRELDLALNARNLAIAEAKNLDVAVPCALCYGRLKNTELELKKDNELKENINSLIGADYEGNNRVYSILEIMTKIIDQQMINNRSLKFLDGLKVACYYGCFHVKSPEASEFDNSENPNYMDSLMEAIGATPVDWAHKTECCGGGLIGAKKDIVIKLSGNLLKLSRAHEADIIATACPLCQLNIEMSQLEINNELGENLGIPVVYFTELIGYSIGIDPEKLGMFKHSNNPLPILEEHTT